MVSCDTILSKEPVVWSRFTKLILNAYSFYRTERILCNNLAYRGAKSVYDVMILYGDNPTGLFGSRNHSFRIKRFDCMHINKPHGYALTLEFLCSGISH